MKSRLRKNRKSTYIIQNIVREVKEERPETTLYHTNKLTAKGKLRGTVKFTPRFILPALTLVRMVYTQITSRRPRYEEVSKMPTTYIGRMKPLNKGLYKNNPI